MIRALGDKKGKVLIALSFKKSVEKGEIKKDNLCEETVDSFNMLFQELNSLILEDNKEKES